MNYLIILILILVVVIVVLAQAKYKVCPSLRKEDKKGIVKHQAKEKEKNLEKVVEMLKNRKKVTNDEIEKLLKVSDSTAERYLDELEKRGLVRQIGRVGQSVHYEVVNGSTPR